MASRAITDLDPALQPLCNQFLTQCQAEGINAFITCSFRSSEEQDALYAQGRSLPGNIITDAKGGQSAHNCVDASGNPAAKAFDFAIQGADGQLDWNASDSQWQRAIAIGESLGLVSGSEWHGNLKDSPHLELANWNEPAGH